MSAELSPLGDVPARCDETSVAARRRGVPGGRYAPRNCSPEALTASTPVPAFALAVSRALGVVVVTAHGHLGLPESAVLRAVLIDLIDGQGNLTVVVDLRDVPGLDGPSVAVLVAASDAAALLGGDVTFADPSEAAATALRTAGLGGAITWTKQRGQRGPATLPIGRGGGTARRATMAQHPAGIGGHREHPRSLVDRPDDAAAPEG